MIARTRCVGCGERGGLLCPSCTVLLTQGLLSSEDRYRDAALLIGWRLAEQFWPTASVAERARNLVRVLEIVQEVRHRS